ncbi:MAG: Uma2 family endonuclease [Gemmataceae bacterium]
MATGAIPNPPPTRLAAGIAPFPVMRFTVDDYHLMAARDVFRPGKRIELIWGFLVSNMPPYPPHSFAVTTLTTLFIQMFDTSVVVRSQQPITLPEQDSEPEPDVCLVRPRSHRYIQEHPSAQDVLLVVEVSDSSLVYDRGVKLEMYASAKVPQYWVVNIPERRVEVYTSPLPGLTPAYQQVDYYDTSVPLRIDGNEYEPLLVSDLIPPRPDRRDHLPHQV